MPSTLNSGDTAWMLTSTALVLLMTIPGVALFYGGMVRRKNVLATVMQSFAVTCLVTVLWMVIGYSLAFTPGTAVIGGTSRLFLSGMGLDAVNDMLQSFEVPVIFITAYPERLLTGQRPEPTFLITKPFQPSTVKAIMSQALFFNRKASTAKPR